MSLYSAATTVTASNTGFDSEEDTLDDKRGSSTPSTGSAIPQPHDESHSDWEDTDITLQTSKNDTSFTAADHPESSNNAEDMSTTNSRLKENISP